VSLDFIAAENSATVTALLKASSVLNPACNRRLSLDLPLPLQRVQVTKSSLIVGETV